jgi:hypothetical protein
MQISFETIISAIAIITSIVSLLYTIYSNNRRELISALMNNLNALAQIEAKNWREPRFVGIARYYCHTVRRDKHFEQRTSILIVQLYSR